MKSPLFFGRALKNQKLITCTRHVGNGTYKHNRLVLGGKVSCLAGGSFIVSEVPSRKNFLGCRFYHHSSRLPGRHRVVITGLGAITPLGPDLESTWKAVIESTRPNNQPHSRDILGKHPNQGITTLYSALQQQNLSTAQLENEWNILESTSCQVAASVLNEWITHHPRYSHPLTSESTSNTSPPWNDGRTSRFVQLALIAAEEAIRSSKLDHWLGMAPTSIPSPGQTSDKINRSSSDGDLKIHQSKKMDINDAIHEGKSENQDPDKVYQKRRESIGVSMGNGMSSTRDISQASSLLNSSADSNRPNRKHRQISPHFVPQILPNSPSSRIAIHHKLMGPNLSHSEACAAGACAIAHAVELIRSGRVMGMVAGGCESAVEALGLVGFGRLRALSSGFDGHGEEDQACHNPQKASRPFDSKRNGFVLAEGSAVMVLEEYQHAISRGAPILAEVLGVGYSGDAFHITAPEVGGEGAARAMLGSIKDAKLSSCNEVDVDGMAVVNSMNDVDYVNAHATSTPIGDVAEIRAIRLAMTQGNGSCPGFDCERMDSTSSKPHQLLVSSTKGATGHLLGAAGAIEAALTVLTVSRNVAPPTKNLDVIDDDILQVLDGANGNVDKQDKNNDDGDIRDTTNEKSTETMALTSTEELCNLRHRTIHLIQKDPIASQPINVALSNSFGFGGTNVSLLFGKLK